MSSIELATYLNRIRRTDDIGRLRALAVEIDIAFPADFATLPLLRMIGLKVVRIERTN